MPGAIDWFHPAHTYPTVPATAIGKPQAALVPTACWIGTLPRVRNGTVRKPPPAPSNADSPPISVPMPNMPPPPGSRPPAAAGFCRSICVAMNTRNRPKPVASQAPRSAAATCAPASEPTTMPGASVRTTSQRTDPLRWWARTLEIEVKTIVVSEVAIATLTMCSSANPCACSSIDMNGTISMPPPMPRSPARKPTTAPSSSIQAIRLGSTAFPVATLGRVRGGGC